MNNGEQIKRAISFTDSIHIVTENSKELSYEYRQITKIFETQNLLILKIGTVVGILLDKNNFKLGNYEGFYKFITEKCATAKYKNIYLKQI